MKQLWEKVVTRRGESQGYQYAGLAFILRLITPIYQFFSRQRLKQRSKQCSNSLQARVISIGNITVGGSGKTPIVSYLAERFIDRGKKVAIIHSGYGRKRKENILIDYGRGGDFSLDQTGDETAMLFRQIPGAAFAIGRDKKKMVGIADQKFKPDVIIIDDGYQRLDIKKDIDIAVVDETMLKDLASGSPDIGYRLFPSGFLREKWSSLGRANAIFVTRGSNRPDDEFMISELRKYNDKAPIIIWSLMISDIEHNGRKLGLDILKGKKPCLFAGIGSYSRLQQMVENMGIIVAGNIRYDDHVEYDRSKIEQLSRDSTSMGADCYLTTAKDMVKLPSEGLDKPVYCLRLTVCPDDSAIVNDIVGLDTS